MTIDSEKIKDALDRFEEDSFSDSKDIISGEIKSARDKFLKDKLGLKDWGKEASSDEN